MENYMTTSDEVKKTQILSIDSEIEKSRAIQEVQGAIFMARKFPRDEMLSAKKILHMAKYVEFAEKALYAYPRGGNMITGLSIRAAESMARCWGNLSYGTKNLQQNISENISEILAYCWDLETNVRSEKIFKSKLVREYKNGAVNLTSARDIYEKEANDSSRRLRSCILAIIPDYIQEKFIKQCEKTLIGEIESSLQDKIVALINDFKKIGISEEIIIAKMGVPLNKLVAKNIVFLTTIYNSIKDGFAPASHFFDIKPEEQKKVNEVLSSLKKGKKNKNEIADVAPEVEKQAETFYEQLEMNNAEA